MKTRAARIQRAASVTAAPSRPAPRAPEPPQGLLALQHTAGNQAVQRLIASGGLVQRDHHLPQFKTGGTSTLPPQKPPPPTPRLGNSRMRHSNPPPPPTTTTTGSKAPTNAPPLTPPKQKEMDELGKSPEVWAKESVDAAYAATVDAIKAFNVSVKTRLGTAGVTGISTPTTTAGMTRLMDSLVTDMLGVVVGESVGEKDSKGKAKKKRKKYVFDATRFAGLVPFIDSALETRAKQGPKQGSETPAKDEYIRMAAQANSVVGMKPKKKEKLVKQVGLAAAEQGAEKALRTNPTVLGEANKHRPALKTAADKAAGDVFALQTDVNITAFRRELQNAKLLKASFEGKADRRDLIANADRLRIRVEDRGSSAAVDAIETLASDAAEAAVGESLNEVAPKAGVDLQRLLTRDEALRQRLITSVSTETDRLLKDPAFQTQAVAEAVNATMEGKMHSKLKFVGSVCGKPKRIGDTQKIDVIIRAPVDPSGIGYVGFQVRTTSRRNEDMSLNMHAELNIIGGAKVPGVDVEAMGQLGGYFDIKVAHDPSGQKKEAEVAGDMLSYAMYRRFRESPIIPHGVANALWGMGGKTAGVGESKADAKYRESETWAKAVEEGLDERDYVETGGLVGGRVKAGISGGGAKVGVKGGVGVLTGKRYTKKTIEEGRKKQSGITGNKAKAVKLGEGVTTLRADAAATIGPLTAGAQFQVTFRDRPKDGEDRVVEARLDIYAQGMVMKKAMFGDPAEAAIRLATWLAEIGLLGRGIIDRAEEQATSMQKAKTEWKDITLMRKGQRLGMEGFNTGAALFQGEWGTQHAAFEQQQAILEGSSTMSEVGGKMGEMGGNIGSGVVESGSNVPGVFTSIPQSVGGLNGAPTQQALQNVVRPLQPALQNLGELRQMILDKTAGLKINVGMEWPADGKFTGVIGLDYVKRTGAFILNNLRTTGFVDASFEKTNRLVGIQFAPTTKVTWLYDDVDKQKLIQAKEWTTRNLKKAYRVI